MMRPLHHAKPPMSIIVLADARSHNDAVGGFATCIDLNPG
jgi:hypothetical protein